MNIVERIIGHSRPKESEISADEVRLSAKKSFALWQVDNHPLKSMA